MTNPKIFISYGWENPSHKYWVTRLAARLRGDGVETVLDQWELAPGDQLAAFMERSIRTSDFVLIVCTPKYRDKSDSRKGGVGYEGDIMTSEVATGTDRRKFIPLLRKNSWGKAAPSWLKGSYYIDLRGDPYSEENYIDLLNTLLDRRKKAPVVKNNDTDMSQRPNKSDKDDFDIPSPVKAYMSARAWLAEQKSKFPIAVDPAQIGWYPALTKSGGGYFYDEVLEYRVWIHPGIGGPDLSEGNDYFCAFPSYEQALEFAKEMPGAEQPLVLVRQKEHVNESEPGKFVHVIGNRITEWQVVWLEGRKREPNTISDFLEANNA